MIKGYMESTLSQSEVFKGLDENLHVREKAISLIKTAQKLTNEDIEPAYIQVKQITDSLTMEAVKAFDNEQTVLIYNNVPKLTLTQAVPFLTFRRPNGFVTYVFADKYITMSRDNVLTIQPSILRDLLTGAVVSNGIKRNYDMMASNSYLEKVCMQMYTQFFTRILNREYSIAADKVVFDEIRYYVNRFFVERVFGASDTPENIDRLAKEHIRYADEIQIENIKNVYDDVNPVTISELLSMFRELAPRLKSANIGTFTNDWINFYYPQAMLAMDSIEYFMFMCLTLLSGNSIINVAASDIVKEQKNIKSFRSELLKLVK